MVYRKKTNKKRTFRKKNTKKNTKNNKKYKGGAKLEWTDEDGQSNVYTYLDDRVFLGDLEPGMPFKLVLLLMQGYTGQKEDAIYQEAKAYVSAYPEHPERNRVEDGRAHPERSGAEARGGPDEEEDEEEDEAEYAQIRPIGAQACACAPPPMNMPQSHEDMHMGDGTTKQKYWICKKIKQLVEDGGAPRANKTGTIPWPSYHALKLPTVMKHACGTTVTLSEITDYVHTLPKLKLCMLTFSVGIARHSICVQFTKTEMIVVDHYGDNRGATGHLHKGEDSWKQYNDLMNELENQNKDKKFIFLPIDEELKYLGLRNQRNHPKEGACEYYASNYWHVHKDDPPPPPQAKKK